jgi:hypothetical protein
MLCPATRMASSSTFLQLMHINLQGWKLLCDVSKGGQRPLIPGEQMYTVVLAFQGLAHPGIRATRHLISAQVIWRGISSGIAAWCRDCQQYAIARGKTSHQPAVSMKTIFVPKRRFTHVHVDIVGPLYQHQQRGFIYLFTICGQVHQMAGGSPHQVHFSPEVRGHILCHEGGQVPSSGYTITSDEGRHVTNHFFPMNRTAHCAQPVF